MKSKMIIITLHLQDLASWIEDDHEKSAESAQNYMEGAC